MSLDTQKQEQETKVLDKLYNDIKLNSKEHIVSSWDSIYAIAKDNSMNVDDLLLLNSIIGKEFQIRGKNVLIKAWDIVYIPKNIDIFNNNLSKLREIKEILNINEKLTKSELNTLKLDTNLYPRRVQSIGLAKVLDGFSSSQESEMDPRLPRIVDSGRETQVSCANLIRTLMAQSVNVWYLKNDEKAFLKKQNLHAWILPTELKNIWYDQKFEELMSFFDKDKIWQMNPIDNQKSYDQKIIELNNYLEKNWVPGSLVPYYFKYSKFKWVVADYNRRRPEDDKHYNTHQSMFAWKADMKFEAYEIKDYSIPGKITNFGWDKEKINKEIKDLSGELELAKADLIKTKSILLKSVDLSENEDIKKADAYMNKGLWVATGKNQAKIDELKIIIKSWLSPDSLKLEIEKALKRKITEADLVRILALRKVYNTTYDSVLAINKNLAKGVQLQEVSWKVKSNASIIANIAKYNDALEIIRDNQIKIKDLKEKLKIERKVTLVDYTANFIQDRLDYGPVAFSPESRAKIIEWIIKYNSLIHIKVNWQRILLDMEARNYQKGLSTIFVKPETKIEISGPMMIDWEHQLNSPDKDRQKKMNSRTRFFFEFMIPGTYLATELLEPGKNSSFRKTEFGKPSDKFEVKWVYDVRRWETVEKALKAKIIIFEKLNPKDPKFTSKLNYIYGLQIKALKIAGFLQDEQNLNPGAFKINRVIPYYDLGNIEKVFSAYIKDKKHTIRETQEQLKEIKNFVSVDVFPWDTEYHVFDRLKSSLVWANIKKYPHVDNIADLNYFQQKKLIKTLLEWFYDRNRHIISWKKLVVSFTKLDEVLQNISKESFVAAPRLNNIDEFVIENVSKIKQNQNLMKNILHNELYSDDTNNSIISRKFIKWKLENINMVSSIWDFQIRINFLQNWWNEWLNKETMNRVFETLEDKNIKNKIASFSPDEQDTINEDLEEVKKLKILTNKKNPSKEDFNEIYEILRDLIRLNSGDDSNYVWKVISSVFMEEKLNNHFEKLAWIMTYSGEDLDEVYSNPSKMKEYERVVMLINNQWERNALIALCENYILRLINNGFWINLETKSVYDDSVKWKALWKIDYGSLVFKEHLKSYIDQLNTHILPLEQKNLKNILERFYIDLDDAKWIKEFSNTIYKFMKSPVIDKFMLHKNLSTSILPENSEYTSSEFQKSAFNYIIKSF